MYENRIIRKQEACMLIISITFNNQAILLHGLRYWDRILFLWMNWIFPIKNYIFMGYWWDMYM